MRERTALAMGIETRALFSPEARMIKNVGRFPYRKAEEQPGVKQKHPSRHSGHDARDRTSPRTHATAAALSRSRSALPARPGPSKRREAERSVSASLVGAGRN